MSNEDMWYRSRHVVPLDSDMNLHLCWMMKQVTLARSEDSCDWFQGDH